jgi:hypothetical protein
VRDQPPTRLDEALLEAGQRELRVQSVAGVAQVFGDDRPQPEAFVQLADQHQPGIRGQAGGYYGLFGLEPVSGSRVATAGDADAGESMAGSGLIGARVRRRCATWRRGSFAACPRFPAAVGTPRPYRRGLRNMGTSVGDVPAWMVPTISKP